MDFNQWLQSRLTAHGYAVGPIDGVIGEKTIAALKAFERSRGLAVDGTADKAVVALLREASSTVSSDVRAAIPNRDAESFAGHAVMNGWPRQGQVAEFYGPVGSEQVAIELPFDMVLAWDRSFTVRKMTLHEKVAESAARVFAVIEATYSRREREDIGLNVFGGSLNVRRKRGGSTYSMHSWGIAIDFDPERNQLNWGRDKARLAREDAVPFWRAWEAEGWLSLGRARNFDWMHVQAARL